MCKMLKILQKIFKALEKDPFPPPAAPQAPSRKDPFPPASAIAARRFRAKAEVARLAEESSRALHSLRLHAWAWEATRCTTFIHQAMYIWSLRKSSVSNSSQVLAALHRRYIHTLQVSFIIRFKIISNSFHISLVDRTLNYGAAYASLLE